MKKTWIVVALAGAVAAGWTPRTVAVPEETQTPEAVKVPIEVRFEAKVPPELGKPVPIALIVDSVPEAWPAGIGEGSRIELLLRLPVGVQLKSEGWTSAPLPDTEKEDASGPWSLFEKKVPLQIQGTDRPETLLKENVELAVTEEGTNWIITARARLVQGQEAWQTFGVLFATLQGGQAEFHHIPKTPTDAQRAQAN